MQDCLCRLPTLASQAMQPRKDRAAFGRGVGGAGRADVSLPPHSSLPPPPWAPPQLPQTLPPLVAPSAPDLLVPNMPSIATAARQKHTAQLPTLGAPVTTNAVEKPAAAIPQVVHARLPIPAARPTQQACSTHAVARQLGVEAVDAAHAEPSALEPPAQEMQLWNALSDGGPFSRVSSLTAAPAGINGGTRPRSSWAATQAAREATAL
jgi:hypothetical protein